ncbi:hypothetical protein PtA15_2A441 [Puccinia triticina]|nr:uncharacterized protein PtA15_2A441 [Puccinia triticina]WAQ82127.1 hypothetical protein PtA15_2A441 [Puccinia triticina]
MARSENLARPEDHNGFKPEATSDFYALGIVKLQNQFRTAGLDNFKPISPGIMQLNEQNQESNNQMQAEVEANESGNELSDQSNESSEEGSN